jgi:hypothetical protein
MSERKIVEARGEGKLNLGALKGLLEPSPKPQITRVRIVKRDANGNVIEDVTAEYGNDR